MDRTGQLWASNKKAESVNLYVIVASQQMDDHYDHTVAVFTNGKLLRKDMHVKETKAWETYIKLVRVA